jgi:DNA-binding winged helix-turn-helix (wHTH) protein
MPSSLPERRPKPVRARFGGFVFDSNVRALTQGGKPAALSPKGFELLEALLASRPRVLSQAELRDLLWPATFVSRTSLARLVTEIRGALGDDAREPRFVRTVHGFGYAFGGAAHDIPESRRLAAKCALLWGGREIDLAEGENLIGRTAECAVRTPSPRISRHHARIVVTGGKAVLEDLGSKNGTCVRGRRLRGPAALKDGDQILLGSEMLTFLAAGGAGSTQTEGRS